MSIRQGNNIIAGSTSYCPNIFDVKWSDHILNDIQWLRSDTFSWQSGAVYEAAYNHLVNDISGISPVSITVYNTGLGVNETYTRSPNDDITDYYAWDLGGVIIYTSSLTPQVGDLAYEQFSPVKSYSIVSLEGPESETVAGTTITFYIAPDGHKICLPDQSNNIEAIYAATGIAWYYILDTANQRFKLPRTKFGFMGLRDTVGDYVEPGLPNITGDTVFKVATTNSSTDPATQTTGAISAVETSKNGGGNGTSTYIARILIDASNSDSTYGNSTTVQPPATQMYLYFYVGQFTQTALENTAGITAESLNAKVDRDGQNVDNVAGADMVVEFQLPTTENNHTWYRKYKSGWVEQGGTLSTGGSGNNTVNLPITMTDTSYWIQVSRQSGESTTTNINVWSRTPTTGSQFVIYASGDTGVKWEVRGVAAS